MKIEVHTDLASLADIWPALDVQGPHRAFAFQARDVLEVWLETIGAARGTQPQFVHVAKSDGGPLMLLPLGVERKNRIRILGFLDGGVCDYNAPVLFPGAEELDEGQMARLWPAIYERLPAFDVAAFNKIPATVEGMRNPHQYLVGDPDIDCGHSIRLNGQVHKFRDTPRKRRRISELTPLVHVVANNPSVAQRFLDLMIEQKTRRYVQTRGVDGFERPGYRAYYQRMTDRFAASGAIHLSVLMAGSEPISTHWGIVTSNRFYSLMPAFVDGEWARYSPGLLHLEELIDWSVDNRKATFDLGVGNEPYKYRIANETLPLYRGMHARTPAGYAYVAAVHARRRLAKGPLGAAWRGLRGRLRAVAHS